MAAFLKFKEDEQKREQERQSAIHRNPNEVKVDQTKIVNDVKQPTDQQNRIKAKQAEEELRR